MFRIVRDVLLIGFVLAGILAASQVPRYVQEYEQRLGGARDEMARMLVEFTSIAQKSGDDLNGYTEKLASNPDPAISATGRRIRALAIREVDLSRHAETLATTARLLKPFQMLSAGDREIMAAAWAIYRYTLTVDPEFAVIGLVVGWLMHWLLAAIIGAILPRRSTVRLKRGRLHRG